MTQSSLLKAIKIIADKDVCQKTSADYYPKAVDKPEPENYFQNL